MSATPLTIAIGCFAAGSLVAVGVAQATSAPTAIPNSSTGVITSCVKKQGGQVRFVDAQAGKKCKKSERKVTFNQTGQAGAPGPQGSKGAQGDKGERGPSNAYVKESTASVNVDNALVISPGPPLRNSVVAVTVPPGSYTVTGSTQMARTTNTTTGIGCDIAATAGTVTGGVVSEEFAAGPPPNYFHAFSPNATLTTNAETTVFLRCFPDSTTAFTGGAQSAGATITATKVADLTVQ